ncbi:sulfite exporter TauE/SafE family protein, partial [Fusobacterium necrophorum]|uniref:sulfite exporter TauE/SafE family protein n=1 Tax=Fusobacterium necrophorum TaxID=859 RepID=UPI00255182EA
MMVAVAIGAALGGFVQGLSGFAFGLVAMAVWAWWLDPVLAAPLVVFGSLLGQALSMGALRRGFDARRALPVLAGGVLGVPIGVALLRGIDPLVFRLCVGLLLLVWCPVMLLARELPL